MNKRNTSNIRTTTTEDEDSGAEGRKKDIKHSRVDGVKGSTRVLHVSTTYSK